MATPRSALVACVFAITLNGCVSMAGLQDWNYKRVNKARAKQAWLECHSREQRACLGCDYEQGYKAGFVDAATGVSCSVPAVAPPKYWAGRYQSCEGQVCIENWFNGYRAGLTAAQTRCFADFSQIPVSACAPILNGAGCGNCYDQPACSCGGSHGTYGHASPSFGEQTLGAGTAAPHDLSEFIDIPAETDAEGVFPAGFSMVGQVDSEIIAIGMDAPPVRSSSLGNAAQ